MSEPKFVAIDGDDVGPQLRNYIINNDIVSAAKFSNNLTHYFQTLSDSLKTKGYEVIFCGGDSLLAISKPDSEDFFFEEIPAGPCTLSIGLGESAEFAYLALQLAKARGKQQVVVLENTQAKTIYTWKQ